MCVCVCVYSVRDIVGLASLFTTQNCLSCYSKLNLGSKLLLISAI